MVVNVVRHSIQAKLLLQIIQTFALVVSESTVGGFPVAEQTTERLFDLAFNGDRHQLTIARFCKDKDVVLRVGAAPFQLDFVFRQQDFADCCPNVNSYTVSPTYNCKCTQHYKI
jgi:hypothetical protein